jgi:hypothetical protein
MSIFGKLFDFDRDGELNGAERAAEHIEEVEIAPSVGLAGGEGEGEIDDAGAVDGEVGIVVGGIIFGAVAGSAVVADGVGALAVIVVLNGNRHFVHLLARNVY